MKYFLSGGVLLVLLLIAGCAGGCKVALEASHKQPTLLIEGKESVAKDNGHEYRVYTDHGTYVVADSILLWDWRASDRYAEIKEGTKMVCDQYGWRIGFFSEFPNLFNCRPA